MADTYTLRMTAEEVLLFAEQLSKDGASDHCKRLGRSLKLYFSDAPPGACPDCGQPLGRESYVSPESSEMVEVYVDGMKGVEARPRNICRGCLRRYYVGRGDGDPFPEDGAL